MKHLFIIPALFFCGMLSAQSDTLFLKKKEKIPVKLSEVSEYELKYTRTDLEESPVYVTSVQNVYKIKYKNGTTQVFTPSELSIPYDVEDIVKQRESFKFHVFDLPTGKVAFGYERVLRPGMNTDLKVGVFSSDLFRAFNTHYEGASLYNPFSANSGNGTFFRGGIKFLTGNDFQMPGMKLAHLLGGCYIRFDAYVSYIHYRRIDYYVPDPNYVQPPPGSNNYYMAQQGIRKSTNANNYNYGFLICAGKQHILANILTLDYYAGLGFNGSSYSFSESDFGPNGPIYSNHYYNGYRYYRPESSNVLAAQRFSNFIAATVGFNIGFIYKRKTKAK